MVTKSEIAVLNALNAQELKKASLTDLRQATGLTQKGVRQVSNRLEGQLMCAIIGREVRLTFAGMQALDEISGMSSDERFHSFRSEQQRKRTALGLRQKGC